METKDALKDMMQSGEGIVTRTNTTLADTDFIHLYDASNNVMRITKAEFQKAMAAEYFRRAPLTDFDLSVLQQAAADQNLEKYGLQVGDKKTINGRTYIIADMNTMKGTGTYRVSTNHVGLIVLPSDTQAWNVSGKTDEGADNRGAGYANSDLHYYLVNTLLPQVQGDLGTSHLLAHKKRFTNTVNPSGYNRLGTDSGCSSNSEWIDNQYISALSEVQMYGGTIWSSSGYDTGEACRQLEVFKKISHTFIFESISIWLRDVVSASRAAIANSGGIASSTSVSNAYYVAALILYK